MLKYVPKALCEIDRSTQGELGPHEGLDRESFLASFEAAWSCLFNRLQAKMGLFRQFQFKLVGLDTRASC
jgi:hypothetical protein